MPPIRPTGPPSEWAALVVPAAVCGIVLAPAAWWWVGPAGVALVLAVCLLEAVALGVVLTRSQRDAGAQLRRPELRNVAGYRPGIFGPLLWEALTRVQELEANVAVATSVRAEVEARSHQSRTRLALLTAAVNAQSDPLLLTDATGAVIHSNPAAAQVLGVSPDRSLAFSTLTLNAIPAVAQIVKELLARPTAESRKTDISLAGNATLDAVPTHRANIASLFSREGRLLGTCVRMTDIRHEGAEKQRHAEFVSSVCHELKTPMAGIKAYSELLRDGAAETDEERDELCGFIESQVDRLTRLVNNMLNLARIQSGVIMVHREDLELNDLLGPAIDTVQQLAEEKQITLTTELSSIYLAVHVDRDLLGQAVINLLSNAVKYTPTGGTVRLTSRLDEDRVTVEVADSGMGIPADSLPRLFERFYRVPQNNAAAAGTGLGLALVKYITADLHNGSIGVKSEVNRGSTFTLSLPFGHHNKRSRSDTPPRPAAAML